MKTKPYENIFAQEFAALIKTINRIDNSKKACCGITMSQCHTIETIAARKTVTMKELSTDLNVDSSTMTRIISVLERDGIVLRKTDHSDRRMVKVTLTQKGKEFYCKIKNNSDEYTKRIFNMLSDTEQKSVSESLQKLNQIMSCNCC